MKNKNLTHYRQYRKHTHLAGVDIEILEYEGNPCIFEIEKAYFSPNENVNGRVGEHYIIQFKGLNKPWVVNSENRNTLTKLAISSGMNRNDARWIENWVGLSIQLFFNPDIKLGGQKTGGVRIRPILPKVKAKPEFTKENFEKALKAKASIEMIKKHYTIALDLENEYINELNKQ